MSTPMGHLLTENRHWLIVGVTVSEANGTAGRQAALDLLTRAKRRYQLRRKTLGADKGCDAGGFFCQMERRKVTPHVSLVMPPRDARTVPQKGQDQAGLDPGAAADAGPHGHGRVQVEPAVPEEGRGGDRRDQDGGRAGAEPLGGAV